MKELRAWGTEQRVRVAEALRDQVHRSRWAPIVQHAGQLATRGRARSRLLWACLPGRSLGSAAQRAPIDASRQAEQAMAYLIIPSATASRDMAALEPTMQALALPGPARRRAIALELMGTSARRGFVVRGATQAALDGAVIQLRAQYPQAELRPLPPEEDPLRLAPGEVISGRELRVAGEAFLSLRIWQARPSPRAQEGADPILGLLGALGEIPAGLRVVAQLALLPAADTWSHGYEGQADTQSLQRLRLDYTLRERERMQAEALREATGIPLPLIVLGLLGVLGWVFWRRLRDGDRGRPSWVPLALWHLLSIPAHAHLGGFGGVLLVVGLALVLGLVLVLAHALRAVPPFSWLRRPGQIYDPDRVATKTQQPAYHTRLRLYVIGAAGQTPQECRVALARRTLLLEHLTAAYRQFHLAGGAHFTVVPLSKRQTRRLVPTLAPIGQPSPSPESAGRRRLIRRGRRKDMRRGTWTSDLARSAGLLSLSEVATLWHLPQAADVNDLAWLRDEERAHTLLAPRPLAVPLPEALPHGSTYDMSTGPAAVLGMGVISALREVTSAGIPADASRLPRSAVASLPGGGPLLLGRSRHAGQEVLVRAPDDLFTRHTLAVAKTGKGKSTLLLLLARLALASGAPAATDRPCLMLLDPHGDLASAFLGLVPPHRRDDVLIMDLADTAYPVALNPLDVTISRARDKAVENLLVIFAAIWRHFWGPRMENALEFALKTLYEANQYLVEQDPQHGPDVQFTLLDVAPLLSIPSFRHRLLGHVRDASLLAWWAHYYEPLDLRMQLEIINPVLTKLAKFSSSQVARRIVGQGRPTLDLSRVVRDGQVLLVNTARGHVGADTAALVGATLLGLLRMTLEEQSRQNAVVRRRISILVDEFQTVPGADFGAMLAELRKYGASFALATQALAQLDAVDRALRPTVLANVDHLFAFAISADDARLLARELDEVVTERDLINLEPLAAYAKLTLDGHRLPVFSLRLDPPLVGDAELRRTLVQASRARIARPAAAVDALLADLAARHTPRAQLDTWVRVATRAASPGRGASGALDGSPTPQSASNQENPAGATDSGGQETAAGRGRGGSRRRRAAADPLSLLGISRRSRGARTSPFDFTAAYPDGGQMDADLRPMGRRDAESGTPADRPHGASEDTRREGMASLFAGSALPWPLEDVTDGPVADSGEEGDADDADDGDDTGETAAAGAGASAGSSAAHLRKRRRGSRGSGRNKLALEAKAASADATPASPLEEEAAALATPDSPTSAISAGGVENDQAEKGKANG